MEQRVVLVDKNDNEIGTEEKLKAHQNGGKLHRAISVFVFNGKGKLMLQKRAMKKYHAKGLWANTCCSHPMHGENPLDAAHRRLKEEMGFDCEMREVFNFTYRADVGSGLTENEFDHIIFGVYEGEPRINGDEVVDWKWMTLDQLKIQIKKNPEEFAPWLVLMIDEILKHRNGQ